MTTPTTENPKFELNPDDPPLDFPAYDTSGHKTYLDYQNNNHGNSGHLSEKSERRHSEVKDALDQIAETPFVEQTWVKVVMWLVIVVAGYRLYLRATGAA